MPPFVPSAVWVLITYCVLIISGAYVLNGGYMWPHAIQ